jgi:hypothetical protein
MGVSQFTVASGGVTIEGVNIDDGVVDLNGKALGLTLDADGDTAIASSTDDQIDFTVGGTIPFQMVGAVLTLASGSSIAGSGSTFTPLIPIAAQQALSGAGAINITTYYTAWTSTSTDAGTLIDGVVKGQLKKIQLIVDGGDATLTPSNLTGGTTVTFADAGDFVVLGWSGTSWVPLELGNAADGATAPVLA